MEECAVCETPRTKVKLIDAISDKGIVRVCESCALANGWMILRRLIPVEADNQTSFQDRVKNFERVFPKKGSVAEDISLRDIVEKNFVKKLPKDKKKRDDLIDNFHWVLMRARRAKKVSVEQMASEIGEASVAIKMAESGVVPDEGYNLVNKLENYLGVVILKDRSKSLDNTIKNVVRKGEIGDVVIDGNSRREVEFDKFSNRIITIEDLRKMKEKKEGFVEKKDELKELEKDIKKRLRVEEKGPLKNDISQDEINRMIFGKK